MMEKVKKGLAVNGPAFISVFSVCPTGWRSAPDLSVRLGRLAVETGIFPLYEVENGRYTLNLDPSPLRPVQDYLKLQGRFRHLSEGMVKQIQDRVIKDYEALKEKAK
jgi:pyruvate ferredoxin oxidoreductase beta subunit